MNKEDSTFPSSMNEYRIHYDASLSTMWGITNCKNLEEMFITADQMGFARVELNHAIDSGLINAVDIERYPVSSIHEPCPADIPMAKLREKDWLVSSPNEDRRKKGVEAIKRSIDLAHNLNVRTIIMHSGQVQSKNDYEKKLRKLFKKGMTDTDEYQKIKMTMVQEREFFINPYLSAVKKSLNELLDYADKRNVRIGLENRFHYLDIPHQDELQELLELADESRLGYIYDVGHAQALDKLGFLSHEMWLKRFSSRMFGAHLHDVRGVDDHWPPGTGDIDFRFVAKYLHPEAFRTCEIQGTHTFQQVQDSLHTLEDAGCIIKLG